MTIHFERKFSAGNKSLLGLGWGRGKPESSSSPVAVQTDFSPGHMLWIFLALLSSAICAHLIDTKNLPAGERVSQESGFCKIRLANTTLHALCLALCSACFLLGACFLPLFQQHGSLSMAAHSAVAVGGMDWWDCGMAKAFGWLAFSSISPLCPVSC